MTDDLTGRTDATAGNTKTCPFCAETIKAEAIKCRYCGERLEGVGAARDERPDRASPTVLLAAVGAGVPAGVAAEASATIHATSSPTNPVGRRAGVRAGVAFVIAGLPAPFFVWKGMIEKASGSDYESTTKALLLTGIGTAPVLAAAAFAFLASLKAVSMSKSWLLLLAAQVLAGAFAMTAVANFVFEAVAGDRGFYVNSPTSMFMVMLVGALMAVAAGYASALKGDSPSSIAASASGRGAMESMKATSACPVCSAQVPEGGASCPECKSPLVEAPGAKEPPIARDGGRGSDERRRMMAFVAVCGVIAVVVLVGGLIASGQR